MTVKNIIKMVEQHNKLANLLQGDEKTISVVSKLGGGCEVTDVSNIKTLKDFNKSVKEFYIDEIVKNIKDCEVTQNNRSLNCFEFSIGSNDFYIEIREII